MSIECPRCKARNPRDGLYCSKRSMALTAKAAWVVDEKSNEARKSSDYEKFLVYIEEGFGEKILLNILILVNDFISACIFFFYSDYFV